ncbi:hypothetical protein OIU78_012392 [Salix suchowensis]|nr:hypothetical protein OIU78_012392 [Salix suchowensis]
MEEPDDFSLSALITGYANQGRMNDARRAFYRKSNSCVVVWNSLISGYVTNSEEIEAFLLFNDMQKKGLKVDFSTLATILSACSSLCNFQYAKQMHAYACKAGLIYDIVVACAFIDAYSKCGNPNDACKLFSELKTYDTILLNSMITVCSNSGKIEDAKQIFNTMPSKSLISWNSMIVGLSQNGCPVQALDLFCMMNKLDLRMDRFNLASVISACASISSLELGEQVFARATVVGLDSDEVISTSLVDFYCKYPSMWSSVLRGCMAHGEKDLGEKVAQHIIELDPVNSGAYVQLSSIFATSGDWESSALVRKMVVHNHEVKQPTVQVYLLMIQSLRLFRVGNGFGLVQGLLKWLKCRVLFVHCSP